MTRSRVAVAVATSTVALGVVAAPFAGPFVTVPTGVAVAGLLGLLIGGARPARRVMAVSAAVSAVSLGVTLLWAAPNSTPIQVAGLAELAALIWLIVLVVRHVPVPQVWFYAGLASVAQATLILRPIKALPPMDQAAAVAFWTTGAVCAILGGSYLRSLDANRVRAVLAARRSQRLELARDLHDFVAHDVSGIVVQAQAAQVIAPHDPDAVLDALKRIEEAGLQALAAMDRTVHMLHDVEESPATGADDTGDEPAGGPELGGPASRMPLVGTADVPDLVARFAASGQSTVDLQVAPDGVQIPREVDTTVYRIIVEALTNVRRHAPTASHVTVVIERSGTAGNPALTVTVTNDSSPASSALAPAGSVGSAASAASAVPASAAFDAGERRGGGLGLLGLTERVEALGGRLSAGPHGSAGWRTTASLPLPSTESA